MKKFCLLTMLLFTAFALSSCSDKSDKELPITPETPETSEPEEPLPDDEEENVTLSLNVVGRYLKDAQGNIVNLHGFARHIAHISMKKVQNGIIMMWMGALSITKE